MTREEAIDILKAIQAFICPNKESVLENNFSEAFDTAIEALSKPNYETDTEVRLAVTNREKEKVILWDSFGEIEYYPIEALQTAEINCVHCPHYYETEDDTDVHGHCDMVSVVRCKDCRYRNGKVNRKGFEVCDATRMDITDEDFCSWGERREE